MYIYTSYIELYFSFSSKPLKIESSKVWKKAKYNLLKNKCLVFYIFIYILKSSHITFKM